MKINEIRNVSKRHIDFRQMDDLTTGGLDRYAYECKLMWLFFCSLYYSFFLPCGSKEYTRRRLNECDLLSSKVLLAKHGQLSICVSSDRHSYGKVLIIFLSNIKFLSPFNGRDIKNTYIYLLSYLHTNFD